MSLIQEALERAGRLPDYKSEIPQPSQTTAARPKRKINFPNPAMNKKAFRGFSLALSAFFLIAGLSYLSVFLLKSFPQKAFPSAIWGGSLSLMSSKTVQKPEFKLTGITYSRNNEPLALINNQVVAVGERLKEEAIVQEIHGRDVTLEFRGSKITLSL